MLTLEDALIDAGYDSSWGIWAKKINGRFELESPARYGQLIFENGGLLDDYEFVCTCTYPSDARVLWVDGAEEDGDWHDGFLDELIEELNEPNEPVRGKEKEPPVQINQYHRQDDHEL